MVSPVEGAARTIQSNSAMRGFQASGVERAVAARAGDAGDVDAERRQPLADQLADRAVADDQRGAALQLDRARGGGAPFVPVGEADYLIVALGRGEHAHHGIFGDGDRVDAGAVGHHDAAIPELRGVIGVNPGAQGGQPFQPLSLRGDGGAVLCALDIDPGDIGIDYRAFRIGARGEPVDVEIGGQMRLDQRTGEGGEDGFHGRSSSAWRAYPKP